MERGARRERYDWLRVREQSIVSSRLFDERDVVQWKVQEEWDGERYDRLSDRYKWVQSIRFDSHPRFYPSVSPVDSNCGRAYALISSRLTTIGGIATGIAMVVASSAIVIYSLTRNTRKRKFSLGNQRSDYPWRERSEWNFINFSDNAPSMQMQNPRAALGIEELKDGWKTSLSLVIYTLNYCNQ